MEKCPGCNGTNINISYEHGDYVSHYQCLDCGATWERAGINRKGATLKKSHPILVFAATIIMGLSMMACTADSEEPTRESGLSTEIEPIIYNIEDTESETAETEATEAEATEAANLDTEATEPTEQEAAMAGVAEPEIQYGQMTVTALNVGQGLSILINADEHLMLYDGGGRETSSYVVSYLKNRGYTDFDYMVSSHYDEDHLAGLVGCLKQYKFGKILCADYTPGTNLYNSFMTAAGENGAEIIHPQQGDQYPLGNAVVTILGPGGYDQAEDNNNSIVVRIEYGDYSCLIEGDAEHKEEEQILESGLNLQSNLLVVGHHGSTSSSSEAFIEAVAPKAALISCGEGNDYGHPTMETISTLEKFNVDIYRTDKQDEIICTSDAKEASYNVVPCEDHSEGHPILNLGEVEVKPTADAGTKEIPKQEASSQKEEDENRTYILNTSTKKIHSPSCGDVKKIKDKNRKEVSTTIDKLLQKGYSTCGHCHAR